MGPGKEQELETPARTKPNAGRWKPGQSGNPKGMAPGCRHRATVFLQALLKGDGERIIRKLSELAQQGDPTALRIAAERLLPPIKSAPIMQFELPPLRTASDGVAAMTLIIEGMTKGELTPDEAEALTSTVSAFIKSVEIAELEQRLAELEAWRAETKPAAESRYNA